MAASPAGRERSSCRAARRPGRWRRPGAAGRRPGDSSRRASPAAPAAGGRRRARARAQFRDTGRAPRAATQASSRSRMASVATPAAIATGFPECARLVDIPLGGEMPHEIAPSAEGPHRRPRGLRREIGRDPVELGGAAARHPETADDLVEDEQGAGARRQVAQMAQELGAPDSRPLFAGTGSITAAMRSPSAAKSASSAPSSSSGRTRVRPAKGAGMPRSSAARRSPAPSRRRPGGIDVAVVAAGELDDEVAAGDAAGQPDGADRRLGAGGDEAHLIEAAVRASTTTVGEVDLEFARCAVGGAVRGGGGDRTA